jgi:hypothetical protein
MRGLHALTDGVRLLMHEICNHHGGMTGINRRPSAEHSTISALPRLSYLGEVSIGNAPTTGLHCYGGG